MRLKLFLENAILTSVYNRINNGKKVCEYQCGEKLVNDNQRELKLRLCKASCDLKWAQEYVKNLQNLLTKNPQDTDLKNAVPNKMKFAQEQVKQARIRFIKARQAVQAMRLRAPADMSARPATPTPVQQG